jgi:hypothetical protein
MAGIILKQSLGQNKIFFLILSFWKGYNKLPVQGYACLKCEKSQNSTHPDEHWEGKSCIEYYLYRYVLPLLLFLLFLVVFLLTDAAASLLLLLLFQLSQLPALGLAKQGRQGDILKRRRP